MVDIIVNIRLHENSCVNININFKSVENYGLVSVNMKVVCKDGKIQNLFNNKLFYISNNSALWSGNIQRSFSSVPLKAIIEIHGSGKLLYIQSFPLEDSNCDEMLYVLNTDVCWRREGPNVISVFNTNGNLLFLKGIYRDLWETLLSPLVPQEVLSTLLKKGYDEPKIKSSINSLIKRGLILEEQKSNIDYI